MGRGPRPAGTPRRGAPRGTPVGCRPLPPALASPRLAAGGAPARAAAAGHCRVAGVTHGASGTCGAGVTRAVAATNVGGAMPLRQVAPSASARALASTDGVASRLRAEGVTIATTFFSPGPRVARPALGARSGARPVLRASGFSGRVGWQRARPAPRPGASTSCVPTAVAFIGGSGATAPSRARAAAAGAGEGHQASTVKKALPPARADLLPIACPRPKRPSIQ